MPIGFDTVGCVIFLGILQELKEGQFAEDAGKLKPLVGGAFSSCVARKFLQHGEVGRYCVMLKAKLA